MKRFIVGVVFIAAAFSLIGCETIKGLGQDMQGGGRNIQKAAS